MAGPAPEQILENLVGFDTTSHRSTAEIVEFICNLTDRSGIRIARYSDADGSKENLVIAAGPPVDPKTRSGLILAGHLDVVPAVEPGWSSDPFRIVDRGDRWVGRGTADMKGFLALAIHRLLELDPEQLAHPLVLLLTRDEEIGSLGAADLVHTTDAKDWPRAAVVGEPTSLRAVRLHKGHLRLEAVFHGQAAHSGYPQRGRNAIEIAGRAIGALSRLAAELAKERGPHSRHFPETPFVALNLGVIEGGTAVNVIPEYCSLQIGMRPLPGDDSGELATRVEARLAEALGPEDWSLRVDNDSPPLETGEEAAIHRSLCRILGQTESHGVSFASDAGFLAALGIEAVLFGPGSIEVAHRANEFLPKEEMDRAGSVLGRLIFEYCGGPQPA